MSLMVEARVEAPELFESFQYMCTAAAAARVETIEV
jgi:hypothetical protein